MIPRGLHHWWWGHIGRKLAPCLCRGRARGQRIHRVDCPRYWPNASYRT